MNAYKKYLTIEDPNNLVLSDLPFTSGQRVEIIILSDEEANKTAETLSSEEFLIQANQAYTELRNNPEAWQEELAERELWEQTIADGVIED